MREQAEDFVRVERPLDEEDGDFSFERRRSRSSASPRRRRPQVQSEPLRQQGKARRKSKRGRQKARRRRAGQLRDKAFEFNLFRENSFLEPDPDFPRRAQGWYRNGDDDSPSSFEDFHLRPERGQQPHEGSEKTLWFYKRWYRKLRRRVDLLITWTFRLFFAGTVLSFLLLWATFFMAVIYVMLYWYFIPTMLHKTALYFDYDAGHNGQLFQSCIHPTYTHTHLYLNGETGLSKVQSLHPEQHVEMPTALVELVHSNYQWDLDESVLDDVKKEREIIQEHKKERARAKLEKKRRKQKVRTQFTNSSPETDEFKNEQRQKREKWTSILEQLHYTEEELSMDSVPDWRINGRYGKDFRYLAPGEKYDIYVHLRLRDSEENYKLANFMIGVELRTFYDKTLASSKRPSIVMKKAASSFFSWFYRNSLLQFIPLIGSWFAPKTEISYDVNGEIKLDIKSFELFQEQQMNFLSVHKAKVTISQPCIQIHSAEISFLCRLEGIRYFMYHWRITTFIVYMTLVITFESTTTLVTSLLLLVIAVTQSETKKLYQ